jgi:uncharacterized heparinase superfamily protein
MKHLVWRAWTGFLRRGLYTGPDEIYLVAPGWRPDNFRVKIISTLPDPRLTVANARQTLRQAGAAMGRVMRPFGRKVPERLLIAPQDLRTSDPTIASEIYAGQLKFAGKLLETHGRSPFELEAPSEAFAVELHGFGWLRHLRAAETALSRANGRALVADWMAANRRGSSGVAARPDVTARRLISWLSQTPLLLEGADAVFYKAFVKAVAQEEYRLSRMVPALPDNEIQLQAQIALVHYALAAVEDDALIRKAAARLCDLLDRQVLPDGGHVTRNPEIVLHLLLDLLPLKLAFISRRIQTPKPIMSAMDRMIPMLRMLRHGDGAIALFNGAGATRADLVAAVLAQDDIMAGPSLRAPYVGYERVEIGASLLLVDAGVPAPLPLAGRMHAAPGAFEFSVENQRIFIGCGAPPLNRSELAAFARLTAAHSTLVVANETIGRFGTGGHLGRQYYGGAQKVSVKRADSADGTLIHVVHDGYRRKFRLSHERKFVLSAEGDRLIGEDKLVPLGQAQGKTGADLAYALRFHLHPLVGASVSADRLTAYVRLPNRSIWEFQAGGMEIEIEESVLFASPEGSRRTSQLVLRGSTATSATIAWTFRKSGKS